MVNDRESQQCPDIETLDISGCYAKVAGISDLVVCLTEKFTCPCMIYFGRERFCIHPANVRIAEASKSG